MSDGKAKAHRNSDGGTPPSGILRSLMLVLSPIRAAANNASSCVAKLGNFENGALDHNRTNNDAQGSCVLAMQPTSTAHHAHSSWGTWIYSRLLFLVFIAYFAALITAALMCAERLPLWFRSSFVRSSAVSWHPTWYLALSAVATLVVVRLAYEIWRGMAGLVTDKLDGFLLEDVGIELTPDEGIALHELVVLAAKKVDSLTPDKLLISPHAECYVCEHRRFGIRTHRTLTLVLGLPHLAVLTAAELEVIIAHELTHFRGGDTRLGVFLSRFLESLREPNDHGLAINRYDPIFWLREGYFRIALYLSAPIWKYQELRADVASARACGGALTARTLIREWLLGQQFDAVVKEYEAMIRSFALFESLATINIFRDFAQRFGCFTLRAEQYALRRLKMEEKASLFDSHPTMEARIDAAAGYPDVPGADQRPASKLISDFAYLEKRMQAQLFQVFAAPKTVECVPGRWHSATPLAKGGLRHGVSPSVDPLAELGASGTSDQR